MNAQLATVAKPYHVGILIFDEVEVLDVCGPFEVFSLAGKLNVDGKLQDGDATTIQVSTIAQHDRLQHARGGLLLQPHFTFANLPTLDLLIAPGGWGTRREVDNPILLEWLRRITAQTAINASVCTGAFLLGKIGLLDGRRATTHWASLDRLADTFPKVDVVRHVRWVDEGAIVSSAGISAGIDMSLHLVARLWGEDLALATAKQMEYEWRQDVSSEKPANI